MMFIRDPEIDLAMAKGGLVLLSGLTALGYVIWLAMKIGIMKSDVHHHPRILKFPAFHHYFTNEKPVKNRSI